MMVVNPSLFSPLSWVSQLSLFYPTVSVPPGSLEIFKGVQELRNVHLVSVIFAQGAGKYSMKRNLETRRLKMGRKTGRKRTRRKRWNSALGGDFWLLGQRCVPDPIPTVFLILGWSEPLPGIATKLCSSFLRFMMSLHSWMSSILRKQKMPGQRCTNSIPHWWDRPDLIWRCNRVVGWQPVRQLEMLSYKLGYWWCSLTNF